MSDPIKPTDEQLAIIAATRTGRSLMARAYAGTAKTTSLKLASHTIKGPALALAFNRKITAELSGAMPPNIPVKSLNGLGHQALQRVVQPKLQLDDRKLGKLLTQISKDRRLNLHADEWDSIRKLTSKAMQSGITPDNIGTPLLADTAENWRDLWDDLGLPGNGEFSQCLDVAHDLLSQNVELALQGHISYDDQIYIPTLIHGIFTKFPVIIGDEFQDFSPLNHRLMLAASNPDTQLILAGDPLQSIYAFRGADAQSMDSIRQWRANWQDLRLTLTFRCPKIVVSRQQSHAPGFRAFESNPQGQFEKIITNSGGEHDHAPGCWDISYILNIHNTHDQNRSIDSIFDIAILCRNNAPLLSMAFKLLRMGIGCQMLGRDIGKGLIALSLKLIPEDSTSARECAKQITNWIEREIGLAIANKKPEKIDSIMDRGDSLQAVLSDANVSNAGQLRAALEKLFSRDSGLITLSTIHRAKGLEWDIVVHLDPWRLPSKFAIASGDPIAIQQEHNLKYVCETRTKHTLIEADLRDFR